MRKITSRTTGLPGRKLICISDATIRPNIHIAKYPITLHKTYVCIKRDYNGVYVQCDSGILAFFALDRFALMICTLPNNVKIL